MLLERVGHQKPGKPGPTGGGWGEAAPEPIGDETRAVGHEPERSGEEESLLAQALASASTDLI